MMRASRPFAAAALLPCLFTGFVLLDAAGNRQNAREPIALGPREVTLDTGSDDNSGATAAIAWDRSSSAPRPWLSVGRLAALGFDTSVPPDAPDAAGHYARQLPRRAYVAFLLREGRGLRSRLVPVEASLDRDQLLRRYPDGRTHLITSALVGIQRDAFPGRRPSLDGYVVNVDPSQVHIPTRFRGRLASAGRSGEVTLLIRYGSRLEPWVEDVR